MTVNTMHRDFVEEIARNVYEEVLNDGQPIVPWHLAQEAERKVLRDMVLVVMKAVSKRGYWISS